ncbi:MAG: tetratricopeptide repeat protein [Janthinobacterium lividum]
MLRLIKTNLNTDITIGDNLAKMAQIIDDPDTYWKNYKHNQETRNSNKTISSKDRRMFKSNEQIFMSEADKLFKEVKKLSSPIIYDTILNMMKVRISSEQHRQIAIATSGGQRNSFSLKDLIKNLYESDPDNASPLLKMYYAENCLLPFPKRYQEGIKLVQPLLKTKEGEVNAYDTFYSNNLLGLLYYKTEQFEQCIELCNRALALKYNHNFYHVLAAANFRVGNYVESKKIFKDLLNVSKEVLKEDGIKKGKLLNNYKILLAQLDNDPDNELKTILLEQQEKKFAKIRQRAARVKKSIEVVKRIQQKNIEINAQAQAKTPILKSPVIEKSESALSENDNFETFSNDKKVIPNTFEPKAKTKTRGKANLQAQRKKVPIQKKISSSTNKNNEEKYLKIEDLLKPSSQAYDIFCKIFERYASNVTDKDVKISLEDIEILMNHLNQDFDKSKGKGSHTKVTINFKKNHIENPAEEQMIILAKHSYLKPYQIKDLREKFIENGFYPNSLKEKLQQKWAIN